MTHGVDINWRKLVVILCSAGDKSYSTPKRCRRSPECGPKQRIRLWTTGQNVRCTPVPRFSLHVNQTHLFKYAVLEVKYIREHFEDAKDALFFLLLLLSSYSTFLRKFTLLAPWKRSRLETIAMCKMASVRSPTFSAN